MAPNRLANRPVLKRLLENSGWALADKVVRLGVGMLVSALLARSFGPSAFGAYSTAASLIALAFSMAGLGLDRVAVRDMVHSGPWAGEILGATLLLKALGGMASFVLALLAVAAIDPSDPSIAPLTLVLGLASMIQSSEAIDLYYQARQQVQAPILVRGAAFLVCLGLRIAILVSGHSLLEFAWVACVEAAITCVLMVAFYLRTGGGLASAGRILERSRRLLGESWPLMVSGAAVMIYLRIDQVMIQWMRGSSDAGLYAAASKLSEAWYFVPMTVVAMAFPSIVEARKTDSRIYEKRLRLLLNGLVFAAVSIAVPATFLSGWLVEWVYGVRYSAAGPILAIHVWTGVFVFLGVARGAWATAEGLTVFVMNASILGAAVNIVLNLFLIPRLGGQGAAWASVIAYALSGYLSCFFDPRTRPLALMMTRSLYTFWRGE